MNCKKLKISINAYLDNNLGEHDKKLIELHLRGCAQCLKEYETLKNIKQILSILNKQSAPSNFENNVMLKIKSGAFAPNPLESFISAAKAALIAAVFIFGIMATFGFSAFSTASKSNTDNVDAMNNYVLKGNAFAKQSGISEAKIMQIMLG
ncbi:MAG: zf-HC2 domain-containing protein [Endomicrobia bacterium]|nr:zf-HC2 domain-containing protein [Endomicrobiia bacterium]